MHTIKFQNFDCVPLENDAISLLVTQSAGPRVISLRFNGGDNIFADLPDFVTERPDGALYHFYGGHRLWHAPENMPRTYVPDDGPVDIISTRTGLSVTQQVEAETGIEKSIRISLVEDKPQVILHHTLTNKGLWPVQTAPWAITQFKTGGVAILPQSQEQHSFLPNRPMALWSYADIANPNVSWGNACILVRAEMPAGTAFKIGFPNSRGWLAYWLNGTLFLKRAAFDARAKYFDHNSSSTSYCNDKFLELETLAPITTLAPGESVSHTETWELYADVAKPDDEAAVQAIIEKFGLE